ncbi:MAG: LuxR C-terminal-related transcriptional regulator [bacterium]
MAIEIQKGPDKPSHEILSDREFHVLCLLEKRKTITDIANELSISVKMAGTYRSRILEKTSLKTNVEMTHYAIQHGLMD